MKALTFTICFQTAQFKVHHQKLARRTYLIPPPSAVAGIFGGILGVPRRELKSYCKQYKILTGAELRGFQGHYVTVSRIFKFDRNKQDITKLLKNWLTNPWDEKIYKNLIGLIPIKESEELYMPEYKLAIAAENWIVDQAFKRLENLDFEFEVFGGNDYHFVEHIGTPVQAKLVRTKEATGYCPLDQLESIKADRYTIIMNSNASMESNLNLPIIMYAPIGPDLIDFIFIYGAKLITKNELDAVEDRESKIFVFDPTRYLVP